MAFIRLFAAALAALALCGAGIGAPASAQAQERYEDTYPVEQLATVLGELHYIYFSCEGRDAQLWRETMLELLEHEAPTRGSYRDRLIAGFNDGFRIQQRNRTRCGAEAEMAERRLAARGRNLSEQLRREYLE
ncbi:MAG: TIGR02301 family protein [Oceanicaulis sp.]